MRNRLGNILWGLVFILIGVGFLGNILWGWDFELFFDGWWTLFIIVPCGISLVQRGPKLGNLIGLSIGVLLLLSETYEMYDFGEMIIPAIFIIIGINVIVKNSSYYNHEKHNTYTSKNGNEDNYDSEEVGSKRTYHKESSNQNNYVGNQATSVLSSKVIDFSNQLFDGITLNSVLGSITLDLRNADIKDGAYIDIAAVLGGVDIFVPSDVEVKVEQVPILGGVSNKPHMSNSTTTIYINATCILGGVSIK
jgi:predicted membrane protein